MSKKSKGASKRGLIDYKIFVPSLLIIIAISIPFSMYEDESFHLLNSIFAQIVDLFSWGYIWYAIILVAAGLYLSFSKYGDVVLGDPTEKPRFTLFEYSSILIAMGLGSTIMRTGMTEWANIAVDPPFGAEAGSADALLWGNAYSMFMWSFQVFAIFVMAAPAMGYILHVRKKPFMRISEACRVIFGDKFTDGLGGTILDIIFLVSILSGAAVTLGLGTPIVTYNLAEIFNIEITFGLTLIVTIVWVFLFSISAYLGIERGIKRLSTFNMYLAGGFAIFIMIVGPGIFILNYFTDTVGFLLSNYVDISLYTNALDMGGTTHMESNTIFWFAYSATWAMLHSIFAAKISRGRTIREMILTYLLAPTLISWVATGILGGLGVHRYLTGEVSVLEVVQEDAMAVIPEILSSLPFSTIALVVFVIIAMIFMVTTLDSTTYTIASYTGTKNMSVAEPSKHLRLIVAAIITVLALALLRIGGLAPLEVLSGIMGIPIIVIQFLTIYAAKKMMDEDKAWINNVRNKKEK
ncbi:choline-glycine betaine transporter [Virgibacillus natechei]|uniref:Choline-glycine betaine transporter n=1 Tax=Virgibacillus natechei TaxID=1216297 RepID=A0ABS4IDV3_9BACI|nr:BCCT family transporter [Virgibacillus natechei]MBP1969112.1 choline-glycine betaine transporter [Virgibacillus natechei]UZD14378.1 BCCT family transporter [Virgibacillus natechei]